MEETSFKVEKLNGENYHSWKFNLKMYLIGKDLWDIVEGTQVLGKDASEDESRKFKKRENLSLSIICLSVSTNLQIYVRNCTTGKEAWDNLANHFEEKTLSKKIFYRRKLYSARMGSSTMETHVNNLKTIAEHLEALDDVVAEKDLVMILISSLPDDYSNLITTLETLKEEKLTWTYVRDRVINEFERKRGGDTISKKKDTRDALFAGGNDKEKYKKGMGKKNFNSYYGSNANNSKSNLKCHHCSEKGHFRRNCPKLKAGVQNFSSNIASCVSQVSNIKLDPTFSPEFALKVSNNSVGDIWWVDSGATQHMTCVKEDFISHSKFDTPVKVNLADDSFLLSYGSGDIRLKLYEGSKNIDVLLKDALFVPGIKNKLFSISSVVEQGGSVTLKDNSCLLEINERMYKIGHKDGKLYRLNCKPEHNCYLGSDMKPLSLWHARYGHLNVNDLKLLVEKKMVSGLALSSNGEVADACDGCVLGKSKRLSFPKKSNHRSSQPLELVHADVCGPLHVVSVGGSRWFVAFVDDYSRYVSVYMMKSKDEVFDKFMQFVKSSENAIGKKIKKLRSDNGGEFTSTKFNNYCEAHGIEKHLTVPYTPQQNGVAERMNRTLMEMTRSMLYHANLPQYLWAEAIATAAYIRNRCPTSSFKEATPYELWFGVKPDVGHLRVFGSDVYVHIPEVKRRKLDKKALKGVFVGYPVGTKGYKIFDPESRKMLCSRDVTFCAKSFQSLNQHINRKEFLNCYGEEFTTDSALVENDVHLDDDVVDSMNGNIHEGLVDYVDSGIDLTCSNMDLPGTDIAVSSSDVDLDIEHNVDVEDLTVRDVVISHSDSVDVEEVISDVENINGKEMGDLRPQRNRKEPDHFGEWTRIAVTEEDPKTFKQAMRSSNVDQWKSAMNEEFSVLMEHNTWDLVDLPKGCNLVGCKWVYKTKRKADGKMDQFKARLVAQGYSQEAGIDYDEVFAPVAKYKSIRSVLANCEST